MDTRLPLSGLTKIPWLSHYFFWLSHYFFFYIFSILQMFSCCFFFKLKASSVLGNNTQFIQMSLKIKNNGCLKFHDFSSILLFSMTFPVYWILSDWNSFSLKDLFEATVPFLLAGTGPRDRTDSLRWRHLEQPVRFRIRCIRILCKNIKTKTSMNFLSIYVTWTVPPALLTLITQLCLYPGFPAGGSNIPL